MNTQAFYNSAAWKKKRLYVLRRDGYACQNCVRYGKFVDADTVHHLKELIDYPELRLKSSNLISLCKACHNKAHGSTKGGSHGRYKNIKQR
jgi:5-methylcytosine-specific restriction enzyme A